MTRPSSYLRLDAFHPDFLTNALTVHSKENEMPKGNRETKKPKAPVRTTTEPALAKLITPPVAASKTKR